MGLNNRRLFNQYGQWNADNRLLNAEDVKPDVINGATGKSAPGSGVPWVDPPATESPWEGGSYNFGGKKTENPVSAYLQSFKPAPTTPTGVATGTATGTATGGTATGGTESDPVKDFYGNYLAEQEKLTNDYYAGVVKGLEEKEKAAQDYYAGVVADINRREQEAQNYYKNAMVLAMTDMEKARQTYGAKAEELAQAGLSDSGLSDYAARQFYSAYVNEKQAIRGEENAAMGALAAERADAAAKQKLDLATIADEKSKAAFDQQGALSDLSYQRAEYEADKQATTEAEKDATEQAGVAAYNALSLLMSSTDAEGNEKTALSYQQAVQELRNQGVSEDAIKEATGKYAASFKTNIEETISKGTVAAVSSISQESLATLVKEGLITQAEADDYVSRAQTKRFDLLDELVDNGDIAGIRSFLAEYTGNSDWLNASETDDASVISSIFSIAGQEGFGTPEQTKAFLANQKKFDVYEESSGQGVLEVGAKTIQGGSPGEWNAYVEAANLTVKHAHGDYGSGHDVTFSIGKDQTLQFDTDPVRNRHKDELPEGNQKEGSLFKTEDGTYYIYWYSNGGKSSSWRRIDFASGGADEDLSGPQTETVKRLLDDLISHQ